MEVVVSATVVVGAAEVLVVTAVDAVAGDSVVGEVETGTEVSEVAGFPLEHEATTTATAAIAARCRRRRRRIMEPTLGR